MSEWPQDPGALPEHDLPVDLPAVVQALVGLLSDAGWKVLEHAPSNVRGLTQASVMAVWTSPDGRTCTVRQEFESGKVELTLPGLALVVEPRATTPATYAILVEAARAGVR